eukprot:Gregarina_sp_Poly_1__1431@NODE_1357_length_4305_cov_171_765691_g13_i1_p3_GENE_NODE_1357_length_4305_cov_171_765691_g13_i1NODE_1357_length_4305_cov_171_765691_g13_i1_p3_ORF_typecomplete_len232_score16_35_NODE_1357_length_4305_cov_171_765691_g13_i111511846
MGLLSWVIRVCALGLVACQTRTSVIFTRGTNARCDAVACAKIDTFQEFEACFEASTSYCYGVLSVEIWGRAEDNGEFCKSDLSGRIFYAFNNLPYIRSQYFKSDPQFANSVEVGFLNSATTKCVFYLLPADDYPANAASCGMPSDSTAGLKLTFTENSYQLLIDAFYLHQLSSQRVGLAGFGTSTACGVRLDSVKFDGVQYSVSVGNQVNSAVSVSLETLGIFAILFSILY